MILSSFRDVRPPHPVVAGDDSEYLSQLDGRVHAQA
jgi:hypothetical protein